MDDKPYLLLLYDIHYALVTQADNLSITHKDRQHFVDLAGQVLDAILFIKADDA